MSAHLPAARTSKAAYAWSGITRRAPARYSTVGVARRVSYGITDYGYAWNEYTPTSTTAVMSPHRIAAEPCRRWSSKLFRPL